MADIDAIPYFQEDAVRFLSIDGAFQQEDASNEFFLMESPDVVRTSIGRIAEGVTEKSDVALISMSAHPMLVGQRPFLQCTNFNRTSPERGSFSMEELLDRLDRISAGTIVVCLDIGPSSLQHFSNVDRDNFLVSVRDLLRSRANPNLWMIVSNSSSEGSYASMELRASVFSFAVTNGLLGAADLNHDSAIDLDEFYRQIVGFTQSHVERESGGNTQQTPVLFATGANRNIPLNTRTIASAPRHAVHSTLLSYVPRLWGGASNDKPNVASADEKDEKAQAEKNWLTSLVVKKSDRVKERALEELEDNINFLPTFLGKRVKQSIGLGEEATLEPIGGKSKTDISQSSSTAAVELDKTNSDASQTSQEPDDLSGSKGVELLVQTTPDLSRLGAANQSNEQLLQLAWQLCENLEKAQNSEMRPMDLAPHAWGEFISYLHGIEQRQRTDAIVDSKNLRLQLTAEIVGSLQFSTTHQARVGTMIKRVAAQMPNLTLPRLALPSVGLVESLANFGSPTISNTLAAQIKQFDTAIKMESPELHDRWLAQLPDELSNQYIEFFWARQFSSRPSSPWGMKRRMLGLWRQFEQLSYDPFNSNVSVQQDLLMTQQRLLEATRIAMDQIGSDWMNRCLQALDQTEQTIKSSSVKQNQLRQALQSRNQRLLELPSILQWREIAVSRLGNHQFDEDIEKILVRLADLCELLQKREECALSDVVRCHHLLESSVKRVQSHWVEETNNLLAGSSTQNVSSNWIVDSLLATSLVRSPLRSRLIVLPIATTTPAESIIDVDPRLPSLSPNLADGKVPREQIRFEIMAARIAGMTLDSPLQLNVLGQNNEPEVDITASQTAVAIDRFYRDLADRIRVAVEEIDGSSTNDTASSQLTRLRLADQSLRMLSPLDSHDFNGKLLEDKLWRIEFFHCVQSKQRITQKCFHDALPQEVPFLRNATERMSLAANALNGVQQVYPRQGSRLNVRGTSSVSLTAEPQSTGEIVFKNVGKAINKAWVLVDFDPDLLELQGPSGVQFYPVRSIPHTIEDARRKAEQNLIGEIAAGATSRDGTSNLLEARKRLSSLQSAMIYPMDPLAAMIAPTMGLAAGQEFTLPFKVSRIGLGPSQTKLVWKLVGDDEYVRHELMIQLPESEKLQLLADGSPNSWAPTHEGIVLYPWPNRPTDFRFGLRNDSGKSRVLSAELIALMERKDITLPDGFLTSVASQEIANNLGETKLIATIPELTLLAKSETFWLPFQPWMERMDAAAIPPPKDVPAKPIATEHGTVIVFTDKTTSQKFWRRIDTRVRHPRSYVEPTVSFDANSERVDIRLKSTQSESIPPNGVAVVGRIVEPLPRGTEMRLEGTVLERETALLYCQVPSVGPRELTFELDVDGFPRAFVLKVPCWRTRTDIPVASDFQRIEIVDPIAGLSIGPKDNSQKVHLKIDAIPGSFETKRDFVEVGWDLDRDREFANETTLKFAADRQVELVINAIVNGHLSMTAKVSDIVVELAPPTLKNERVNLLAKLSSGGEIVWSNPIEMIADSDAPTITGVEIMPGTTFAQGVDLEIRIGVDDAKLSGIGKVEVLMDSKGIGKFTEAAGVPKGCDRQSDGAWTITLPTKDQLPGRSTLMVRATDRVGNQSEISKTVLSIISEQESQDRLKLAVQELTGSVVYSDNPLTNAKVTLEDEKGAIVQRTSTDVRGMFRLPNVLVGKYNIVAIGVLKNRPRKAEQRVEIAAPPAPPPRLRLIAK